MGKTGRLVLRAAAAFILLQIFSAFWVSQEIPRRLGLKANGIFWPLIVWPGFYSPHARLDWKNKVTLLSGSLKIDYNLIPLFLRRSIRIHVTGKNISARLQGDWASMQGVEHITIDEFLADVEVAPHGLSEIYRVKATSPSFQFRIEKTEI